MAIVSAPEDNARPFVEGNTMGEKQHADSRPRGFAALDRIQRLELARRGGLAAHAKGTAHEFSTEEAQRAGRKGGAKVSNDREHMARIGRRGAEVRHHHQPAADEPRRR